MAGFTPDTLAKGVTMRCTLITAAAVTIFATVAGSAVARADVDTYLSDMEAAGFFNHDGNASEISVGKGICAELAEGTSVTYEIKDMWQVSHLEHDEAVEFVSIAVRDLCPQFTSYLP